MMLFMTDIMYFVTYGIEPGIIPGSRWDPDVLPAKYKSADVSFSLWRKLRIKNRRFTIGPYLGKRRLFSSWSIAKLAWFFDPQGLPIATLVIIAFCDSIITAFGSALALEGGTISKITQHLTRLSAFYTFTLYLFLLLSNMLALCILKIC